MGSVNDTFQRKAKKERLDQYMKELHEILVDMDNNTLGRIILECAEVASNREHPQLKGTVRGIALWLTEFVAAGWKLAVDRGEIESVNCLAEPDFLECCKEVGTPACIATGLGHDEYCDTEPRTFTLPDDDEAAALEVANKPFCFTNRNDAVDAFVAATHDLALMMAPEGLDPHDMYVFGLCLAKDFIDEGAKFV